MRIRDFLRYMVWTAIFFQPGTGITAVPSLQNANVTQVSERVYVLVGDMDVPNEKNGGFICNSVFIITDTGVVVVDPGGSLQIGRLIISEIKKRTSKPVTHVFNTHHHADHWMGNHAFAELPEKPQILGHDVMRQTASEIGERWLEIIGQLTNNANQGTKVVLPETLLSGDETLSIGGLSFVLSHPAYAHTQGDIVLYVPEERLLLTGDVLFYQRTPGFQDASPLGNLRALESLQRFDAAAVVPGHGPVTDASGIVWMIDYIKLLQSQVQQYFAAGLQDYEMKDKIDVGHYRHMSGFAERFGINVNRMYLEVESLAFE